MLRSKNLQYCYTRDICSTATQFKCWHQCFVSRQGLYSLHHVDRDILGCLLNYSEKWRGLALSNSGLNILGKLTILTIITSLLNSFDLVTTTLKSPLWLKVTHCLLSRLKSELFFYPSLSTSWPLTASFSNFKLCRSKLMLRIHMLSETSFFCRYNHIHPTCRG